MYLSQILSAIKILLKQFLMDFLGYHLSSSFIYKLSVRLQNIICNWITHLERTRMLTKLPTRPRTETKIIRMLITLENWKWKVNALYVLVAIHRNISIVEDQATKSMREPTLVSVCVSSIWFTSNSRCFSENEWVMREKNKNRKQIYFVLLFGNVKDNCTASLVVEKPSNDQLGVVASKYKCN